MKKIFEKMFNNANAVNKKNIYGCFGRDSEAFFLDLGCNDGEKTKEIATIIKTRNVYGIEIVEQSAKQARDRGVTVMLSDLNNKFPFADNFFDVVCADQVIEHVCNLDLFIGEIFRTLKPGGYVVISTENGSSWHNIFASILGWQTFSGAAISSKRMGIGNPLSLHRGKNSDFLPWAGWMHKVIFNFRGLREIFELFNFCDIKIFGAGYYPLPAIFGKLDPRHAHFITLKAYK